MSRNHLGCWSLHWLLSIHFFNGRSGGPPCSSSGQTRANDQCLAGFGVEASPVAHAKPLLLIMSEQHSAVDDAPVQIELAVLPHLDSLNESRVIWEMNMESEY